jgi:hypothetical protein
MEKMKRKKKLKASLLFKMKNWLLSNQLEVVELENPVLVKPLVQRNSVMKNLKSSKYLRFHPLIITL